MNHKTEWMSPKDYIDVIAKKDAQIKKLKNDLCAETESRNARIKELENAIIRADAILLVPQLESPSIVKTPQVLGAREIFSHALKSPSTSILPKESECRCSAFF